MQLATRCLPAVDNARLEAFVPTSCIVAYICTSARQSQLTEHLSSITTRAERLQVMAKRTPQRIDAADRIDTGMARALALMNALKDLD